MTERFSMSLPDKLMKRFDKYIAKKGYGSRSEAIRDLIRDQLVAEEWEDNSETVGTITLVYDHHIKELGETLTSLQHDHAELIVSTLHVHLDHHNCLEVLVLRGKASSIQKIANDLTSLRGVKLGKLTGATTGRDLE